PAGARPEPVAFLCVLSGLRVRSSWTASEVGEGERRVAAGPGGVEQALGGRGLAAPAECDLRLPQAEQRARVARVARQIVAEYRLGLRQLARQIARGAEQL